MSFFLAQAVTWCTVYGIMNLFFSSPNTPQLEESARDFCDDSLNISCNLAVLQPEAAVGGGPLNENSSEGR